MTDTSTTITERCVASHTNGSKPYPVPVAGHPGCFVVHHGRDYLAADGSVVTTPVHFHHEDCTWVGRDLFVADRSVVGGYAAAQQAIAAHELQVSA